MSRWVRARYYCNNTSKPCKYALGDVPFSAAEFQKFEGCCRGRDADGCGEHLVPGDAQDLRPRILAAAVVATGVMAAVVWVARTVFFPPPLEHVTFASSESRIVDSVGVVELEIVRDADVDRRVEVAFSSADGTAKAGEDYEPVRSALTFERGERRKTIELSVLPDQTLEKGARTFSVSLLNVQGKPRHVIRIAPRPVDRSQQVQAEQMVLAASRIAADIASFMVKRKVLLEVVSGGSAGAAELAEYKQQLMDAQDNLTRAREGYAQALRDLQTYESALIIRIMEHLRADLEQRHFVQQSRALAIMKSQFKELVGGRKIDMDRWTAELESAVPRIDAGGPKVTT